MGIKKGFLASKQQMGVAALIMGVSILLSRFMGLIRDKIISWQFGASGETDLYFAAFVLPDFLNYLLAGGYVSITLIPILSRLFAEDDQKNAWKFFGAVFVWATLSIAFLSSLAWIFAPSIAPVLAPGFDDIQIERLTYFLRIILPAQICFLPGACFSALLYIRKQFVVPALMPLIYNGFILLCGVLMPYFGLVDGMEGFCYGVLVGAFVGAFLLPYIAVKSGGIHWNLCFYHPRLKQFFFLALPLMLGQSVVVLDEQFVRIFGSMAGEGAVSLLSYARRIMMVPVGVVAQAAGVASFPFLAALLAKGDRLGFCQTLNAALKNSFIVVIPLTLFMIAVAMPILGVIFEGGQFTQSHTLKTSPLLQIMLLAVPFWVLQQIIGRAFYAMEDTITPAIVGTVITLFSVPFYYVFSSKFGAFAVALITTTSIMLYALILLFLARKKFKEAFEGIFCVFMKNMLLCVLPFCGVSLVFSQMSDIINSWNFSLLWQQLTQLTACGIIFLFSYLILAKIFLPTNISLLCAPFSRRMKKSKNIVGV